MYSNSSTGGGQSVGSQEIPRGFLAGSSIYPTLAHTDEIVELYGAAIDEVFGEIATALAAGEVLERLKGPVAYMDFRRLT